MARCIFSGAHTIPKIRKYITIQSIPPIFSCKGKKVEKAVGHIVERGVVKNKFIARDGAKSLLNCLTILPIFSWGEINKSSEPLLIN